MEAIKNWNLNLKAHSETHKHPKPNKLIVTGMLRPPKLAWFPNNMQTPSRPYINNLEKINHINSLIRTFNKNINKIETISFSNWGTMLVKLNNGKKAKIHNFKEWREYPNLDQCLHLNNHQRGRMYNKLLSYIENVIIKHR